ncbi:MAG: hypothetical protein U9N61_10975 [Euryarchaeota archaeon]|nr:hypothetical protein [Euryarchaeota archaeon]
MSTEEPKDLIPQEEFSIAKRDSSDIDTYTRTSEFLPQVRVYGSEANIVKEQKFPMGHFGMYFSPEQIVDLGEQFDLLVVDWRPRASIVSGDTPISFFGKFNNESEEWEYAKEFVEIKNRAMSKEKGYLVGLEYLVWVPSIDKFGLFLMGNPTLRRESANMKALCGKAASLKIKLIKTTQYTWHGCTAFACTTPFDIPPMGDISEVVEKFRQPQDSAVEMADDEEKSGRAR